MNPEHSPHLAPLPPPGVHPLHPGQFPSLQAAAQACGARFIPLSLAAISDKAGLLRALGAALDFPDWFGHNWDALEDCLGDLSWIQSNCIVVVIQDAGTLQQCAPADYRVALEIFADAAASQADQGRQLHLFAALPAQG
jgi:RNAse (barnase) inhibitor barstar